MATLQKLINQSNDAPPDISATNYLDTDATIGLVAKKNEQIDDRIKDYESTLQQKTNIFNAAHSQNMKNLGAVINFLPTAKNIYQNQQVYRDNENLLDNLIQEGAKAKARQDDAIDVVAEEIDNEYNELNLTENQTSEVIKRKRELDRKRTQLLEQIKGTDKIIQQKEKTKSSKIRFKIMDILGE